MLAHHHKAIAFIAAILLVFGLAALMASHSPATHAQASFDPNNPTASGYKEVFDDEFNYSDASFVDCSRGQGADAGKIWHAGIWWGGPPGNCTSLFSVANGILHTGDGGQLATIVANDPTSGGIAWKGGYIEGRLKGNDWMSLWMMSLHHAQRVSQTSGNPTSCTSELDIVEGDNGTPNDYVGTLHRDTSGDCGIPDEQNGNNNTDVGVRLQDEWHVYGALWTQSTVTWYLDGKVVHTFPAYDTTWQPMWLTFGGAGGGVNGGPTEQPVYEDVDWIHVWQSDADGDACEGPNCGKSPDSGSTTLVCTNFYKPGVAIPTGYGAAYDLFGSNKLLVQAVCDQGDPTLNVGRASASDYIYKEAYLYQNNAWQPLDLTSNSTLASNAWYPSFAQAKLPTTINFGSWTYAVGYICTWSGTAWKCGCADTACTTANWQLQAFKR